MIRQITAFELKNRLKTEKITILDVRNADERAESKIEGTLFIPLPELPQRMGELDKNQELVIHCRSGKRSMTAAELLEKNGFKNLVNLTGGILEWSKV